MPSPQEMLAELEDKFILGEVMESDYREQKKQLILELRNRGETIRAGSIQVAEGQDSRGTPFCYVPKGPFFFGPDDEYRELKCSYYMSKYPITVAQFQEFLKSGAVQYADEDLQILQLVSPEPTCPVSHLSYLDAKEYCRWLRRETNEYYSLPHEVEWEKAARGEDARYYPWGNEVPGPDSACFQGERKYTCTSPVNTFEKVNRSPYGCIDMVGNLWEWCLDSFDDPRDPHILRGGSWCNGEEYANCLSRPFTYPPTKRIDYGGFRIVYLPAEMLSDYRSTYGDAGKATRISLRVVSVAERADHKRKASKGLAALSRAFDAAAVHAAATPAPELAAEALQEEPAAAAAATEGSAFEVISAGDENAAVNDAMALAISNASSMFLRKDKNADTGRDPDQVGAGPVIGVPDPAAPAGEAPKYKTIRELIQERETAAKAEAEAAGEAGKPQRKIEIGDVDDYEAEKARPIKVPAGVTWSTFVIWCLLLLAVTGIAAFRFVTS